MAQTNKQEESGQLRKALEKERRELRTAQEEAAGLRTALEGERSAVRALRRELAAQVRVAREQEAAKYGHLVEQLKNRLVLEQEEAVKSERETARKASAGELQRALQSLEAELRRAAARREDDLRRQLKEALRQRAPEAGAAPAAANGPSDAAPDDDVVSDRLKMTPSSARGIVPKLLALRAVNKRLEHRVQELLESEKRNADTVRAQHEEHAVKEAEQQRLSRREAHILLEKLKSRDRSIEHLEKEVCVLRGRLEEANSRNRYDPEKPGEPPRLGIKRLNTRNGGLPPEVARARCSRIKEINTNDTINEQTGNCTNSNTTKKETEKENEQPIDEPNEKPNGLDSSTTIRNEMSTKENKETETEPINSTDKETNTEEMNEDSAVNSWTKTVGLENVYRVVVSEHQTLQRAHQALGARLRSEQRARADLEAALRGGRSTASGGGAAAASAAQENPINLAMADRIQELTQRQTELLSENQDLREQNDLLEFRILEMDSAPASLHFKPHSPSSPSRSPESRGDREVDDVSDSGVLSLPTSEDISEADFHELAMEPTNRDVKSRLALLCQSMENVTDRASVQQGLSLLRHYEARLEAALTNMCQDPYSVKTLNVPDSDSSKAQSRIIATVLPFTDLSQSCGKHREEQPTRKLFKDADCLQESGIFEETPEYCSRCTQTDWSPGKLETTTGDLSLEIRKLKQIRERIEEQGGNKRLLKTPGDDEHCTNIDVKELLFYRERAELLENKLAIYESGGDEQVRRLKSRLDRELLLTAEIKHVKTRCQLLEELNRNLEEEKCEFEEAENDTRLRCQKLEVKLSALGEKKSDLQVQLQQNARTMSNLKSCLAEEERKRIEARQHASRMENLVQHYEQRNFELEEKEVEARCKAQMLENTIPALMAYNTFKVTNKMQEAQQPTCRKRSILENKKQILMPSPDTEQSYDSQPDSKSTKNSPCHKSKQPMLTNANQTVNKCKVKKLYSELKSLESNIFSDCERLEQSKTYEEHLQEKVKKLESEIKCKDELQQQSLTPDQKKALFCKVQELKKTNCDLESKLKDLELKEMYYKQTLHQADEMWANMEGNYKEQVRNYEAQLEEKQNEINTIEAIVRKLSGEKEMRQQVQERACAMEKELKDYRLKLVEKELERKALEKERQRVNSELEAANDELNYLKNIVEPQLKQQLEEHKKRSKELKRDLEELEKERELDLEDRMAEVSVLKRKITSLSRELLENECTIGELREEVQTVEIAVVDMRERFEEERDKNERALIKVMSEIDEKNREIHILREKTNGETKLPKSARQELEEAERRLKDCERKEQSLLSDEKQPKPHKRHKMRSPHSTLKKLNERIRAGLLKDDKKSYNVSDSECGFSNESSNKTDLSASHASCSHVSEKEVFTSLGSGDALSLPNISSSDSEVLSRGVEVCASGVCVNSSVGLKCDILPSLSAVKCQKEGGDPHVDCQSTGLVSSSGLQQVKQIENVTESNQRLETKNVQNNNHTNDPNEDDSTTTL